MKLARYIIICVGLLISSFCFAKDDVTVFTSPPSAEELAEIMFPQKTRSIVFTNEESNTSLNSGNKENIDQVSSASSSNDQTLQNQSDSGVFGLLINFHFGKDSVTAESLAYLDAVGKMLNLEQSGDQAIVIEGHTDSIGNERYNQALSERRAIAVSRYLVETHKIDKTRLYTVGRGESLPYDKSNPAAAVNRRVEFKLHKP